MNSLRFEASLCIAYWGSAPNPAKGLASFGILFVYFLGKTYVLPKKEQTIPKDPSPLAGFGAEPHLPSYGDNYG